MMSTTNRDFPSGYVRFDDKVRIRLSAGLSKVEIRELKRKLANELDQVRSFKRRIEAKGNRCGKDNVDRVGTLARVNSEVSYVGHSDLRVEDHDNRDVHGNVDKEKGSTKVSTGNENPGSVVGKGKVLKSVGDKKLKEGGEGTSNGKGEATGFGSGTDEHTKKLFRKCKDLLEKLMKHPYGWVFNVPVDAKKLKLLDYHKIIKRPMDLGTVKTRLTKHWYKLPKGFAEDIRLTFRNAMTYNEKGQDVHAMADVLLKIFEEKWAAIEVELNFHNKLDMGGNASLQKPAKKKAPGAHAPNVVPPNPVPLERRNLDWTESMRMRVDSNSEAANIASNEGKIPVLENFETTDPEKRDMTYEEKQRLSADLQNLPSDKLDGFVEIIRKNNPGLFLQEDEIEVDIESFNSNTLWEIDKFVNDYKKSLSKIEAIAEIPVRSTEGATHNIQEHNLTSFAAEARNEPGSGEKIGTPVLEEKHGDNVSRSSSSGSDSESSSSGSESNSSSGSGSNVGR